MKRIELHLMNQAGETIDPVNSFDLSNEERARDFARILNIHICRLCKGAYFFDISTGVYLRVSITCADDNDARKIYEMFDILPGWVTRLGIIPALYLGRPVCTVWSNPENEQ